MNGDGNSEVSVGGLIGAAKKQQEKARAAAATNTTGTDSPWVKNAEAGKLPYRSTGPENDARNTPTSR